MERELILSHFCLANADFKSRVEAAASAGFSGIGLLIDDYIQLQQQGYSDQQLQSILASAKIKLMEIVVLTGWDGDASSRIKSQQKLTTACHMAAVYNSSYLQVLGGLDSTKQNTIKQLRRVCDQCREVNLQVALEFVPSITNITDLTSATDVVVKTDKENLGICLDTWHFYRDSHYQANLSHQLLRDLPKDLLTLLQMNDGASSPENPDYLQDCLSNRRLFGEGEFPLQEFMQAIDETGYQGPISVEIMSTRLNQLPAQDSTKKMANSARRWVSRL